MVTTLIPLDTEQSTVILFNVSFVIPLFDEAKNKKNKKQSI